MIKESSRAHLTQVHVFHAIPHSGLSVSGSCTISYTSDRDGRVSSNLATDEATMFAGLHKSRRRQYITKCLFIRAQPTRALIDTGGGYHLGALNLQSNPLILLPIQYSSLSPNFPARSHIKPFYQLFKFSTFHSLTMV
jgi:hypothetical protein